MKAQRLRFRFRLSEAARDLRHREVVSAWEDAVRQAGLDLSYSAGKRPGPQISLGAPLPQGLTSDCELVDVFLATRVDPASVLQLVAAHLPPGLEAVSAQEVGVGAPSLQSVLRWAEYEADIPAAGVSREEVDAAVERFLSQRSVMAEHRRERKEREYDVRALVLDIRLGESCAEVYRLRLRLRAEQESTARADETIAALGLPEPVRVHRTRLGLDDSPAAVQAFRRAREPEVR